MTTVAGRAPRSGRPATASAARCASMRAMSTILALSQAAQTTIVYIAIWVIGFPALVTGLIAYAVVQGLGERRADEEARRRRRGS
jgi:hypothetical protein